MQKTLIVALLIINIAFSSAALLKKPSKATFSVYNKLKQVRFSFINFFLMISSDYNPLPFIGFFLPGGNYCEDVYI